MTPRDTYVGSRAGYPPVVIHRFIIGTERKTARDLAACGGVTEVSSRSCAARKLARTLVAAGEADGPILACGSDGVLCYRVNSLHAFARTTLRENPLRIAPFDADEASRLRSFRTAGSEASNGPEQPTPAVQYHIP